MRILASIAVVIVAILLSACGDPGDEAIDFTFTPTVNKELENGRPVYVDERCEAYYADELIVVSNDENLKEAERFIRASGFDILEKTERALGGWRLIVRVPAGSVPDAVRHFSANHDAATVEANGFIGAKVGEILFGCKES